MRVSISILISSLFVSLHAGTVSQDTDRRIVFPDLPDFLTLVCDLHQHTVFSDGSVWPTIRVQEALRDGLDAIAVTEHIEHQPRKADIPHPDRNRAYEIAKEAADGSGLIVIPGSEITRSMPPGHSNAIFVQDVNKLNIEDATDAYREAKQQRAFIFWNHPNWISQTKDGVSRLTDTHRQYIEEGLLDGIEVVNEHTYSDEALQIALEHDLTIIGTSDIHGLIDWDYQVPEGGHRPVTLVLSKERSEAGIQEGLEQGRTVVWFKNTLIGRADYVRPVIEASLQIEAATYLSDSSVAEVRIRNLSDADYQLQNRSEFTLHTDADIVRLHPQTTTSIQVKTLERMDSFDLEFEVLNAVVAPRAHPTIKLAVAVE